MSYTVAPVMRERGRIGDSSVQLVYRVDDGGTERIIRYRPAGRGEITLQRVVLSSDASPTACAALMAGL